MQEMQQRSQSSGRFVATLRGELGRLSRTDRRQKQKREPGATAHITGVFTKEQPGGTGDTEHDNRGDSPAAKNSAWPPRPRQDKQRRNDRDEKENMIEIHDRALRFDF